VRTAALLQSAVNTSSDCNACGLRRSGTFVGSKGLMARDLHRTQNSVEGTPTAAFRFI
jgi:hypothetical protein